MDPTLAIGTVDPSADELRPASSDDALAALAPTDPEAFEALYLRHRLALFRFARSRTDDDEAAADVVATTFERAMVALPRYRPGGAGFRAWLFRIARNEVLDAGRRRRVAQRAHPLAGASRGHHPSPEEQLVAAEEQARIRDLVGRLPDTQRDALLLRYAGGLTAREIADAMGRTEAAAQKLISRALAALKEAYRATDR